MSGSDLPASQTWRQRAEECRTLAENFHNSETRDRMLRVAEDYERMAKRAAGRELASAERAEQQKA